MAKTKRYVVYKDGYKQIPGKRIVDPITYEDTRWYYTGRNRIVDNFLNPGLTENVKQAMQFDSEEDANSVVEFLKNAIQFTVGNNYKVMAV